MRDARTSEAVRLDGDAIAAAALLAVDPVGIGGVALRAGAGAPRDAWLSLLRSLMPEGVPITRLPGHITDDRLLGGLDLAASLASGQRISERGVLAAADGGLLIVPLAERLPVPLAARVASAMDRGGVLVERDGLTLTVSSQFGVIAFDEGVDADERPPAVLLDRLGLHVDLEKPPADCIDCAVARTSVELARARLSDVVLAEEIVEALCAASIELGIVSLNAPYLALKVAAAAAALDGEVVPTAKHVLIAVRLTLAPRASMIQAPESRESESPTEEGQSLPDADDGLDGASLAEIAVAAARAALPSDLLPRVGHARSRSRPRLSDGRAGERRTQLQRGAPCGARQAGLERGGRLNIVETLRAAAPWQRLRGSSCRQGRRRVEVRREDFRIWRFARRSETVTIFVVDASGSAALNRLAEAKGAVELLLADCYVRRDRVAMLAFGGRGAELLLPPTKSLSRAKRQLADLPGGGGTPLAAALEKAALLADLARRRHQTPMIVVLTDGRPNLARDGRRGRQAGESDALDVAARIAASGITALLIDTSVQPDAAAARIAERMGARYVPLPHADAHAVSQVVRAGIGGSRM